MRARNSLFRSLRQPEPIISSENRWLRRFRVALADGSQRGESCVGIEGPRLVEEALRSGIPIEAILTSETGRKHLAKIVHRLEPSVRVLATSDRLFQRIANTQTPQGIAALVTPRASAFDDLVRGPDAALIVVMCGLQDPGNVGTILRTAEALGASGAAACAAGNLQTARVFSPKVMRASAGAALRFPVLEGVMPAILLAQLRVSGVKSFATSSAITGDETRKVFAPWEIDLRGPVAMFIGSEGSGLPAELVRSNDATLRIPFAAAHDTHVESLNAATAAAILLYEAARQRNVGTETTKQHEERAAHRISL